MNRNEIIENIYKDKKYIEYCKQVCRSDLYQDLFQYTILYLMEMPESKLIALSESGDLRMYIARIIYINAKSERSDFNKKYKDKIIYNEFIEYEPFNEDLFIEVNKEIKHEMIECTKKNIYPASVKLLEIYAECGSYQEVANRTKIPYKTVRRHIITLREKIIKNINDKTVISKIINEK